MFNFSKNEFFLITPQSNHVLNKEHKVFLRHLFCRYSFEAFMTVIMQNIVKELSALDYELHTWFCYLRSTPPVCKQNYKNNFRGYFKINLQRASWIYFTFTVIHCRPPLQCPCNGQDCKNKKVVFFYSLRIFICVCYITTRSLCLISIVIKFSGF